MDPNRADRLLERLERLLDRIEPLLPAVPGPPDWEAAVAFRWRRAEGRRYLQAVADMHRIALDDLQGIDRQKEILERNTRQFVRGLPANNALLWGSRGTGKSSLVKALVNAFAPQGLRVIEVDKSDLVDLPDVVDQIQGRPERFIVFSDDLSFEPGDASYKALKGALDGSVHAPPENVLLYVTSNRRHLIPEYMHENLEAKPVAGEIHQGEAVEEKISLSERFGLWLSFYPFKQEEYLRIVFHWLEVFGERPVDEDRVRQAALQWALTRGSRSGRSAYQFARDWAGRRALAQ